jgi:hypothetical protein
MAEVTFDKRIKRNVIIFGEYKQWAVSVENNSLQFHHQFDSYPEKISKYLWKEAFEFIIDNGGFNKIRNQLLSFDPLVSLK